MKVEQFAEALRRITFRGLLMQLDMRVEIESLADDNALLFVRWFTFDSYARKRARVCFTMQTPVSDSTLLSLQGDADVFELVRDILHDLVKHEVDEGLFVDGACLNDPHEEERRRDARLADLVRGALRKHGLHE